MDKKRNLFHRKIETGIKYLDEGIEKQVVIQQQEAIYPYNHIRTWINGVPTKKGRDTEAYRATKLDLGDDWSSDITDSWWDLNHPLGARKQARLQEIIRENGINQEHDPKAHGCKYLGMNMWSCGHCDNEAD